MGKKRGWDFKEATSEEDERAVVLPVARPVGPLPNTGTSALLPRHLLAFLASLRETDRNGLFAAFHFAALAAATALRLATLVAVHLVLHFLARAAGILAFAFPLFRHVELLGLAGTPGRRWCCQ